MSSEQSSTPRKSVITHTHNVLATIKEFALKTKLPPERVDFELRSVTTILKKDEKVGNVFQEVIILETQGRPEITTEQWLDKDIKISQSYEIELFAYEHKDISLHVGIGANSYYTNVAAFIKKDSKLHFFDGLLDYIIGDLNRRKLRHELLINIFDDQMIMEVEKLAKLIKAQGKLERDTKINLFQGPDFIPSTDDSIHFVYQTQAAGFASKYVGVAKDDVLVEYHKPSMGKASRNAKGKYINCFEPQSKYVIDFTPTDAVRIEDTEQKLSYIAQKSGFASIEDKVLDIKEELCITNLDFKIGSIDLGMKEGTKIEISEKDTETDAIADGLKVRAYELTVKGNIGADTVLETNTVHISGQTHGTSKVYAKNAEIKTLKGFLSTEKAKIGVIENGVVEASSATFTSALGSTISASECRIEIMGSNSTITVSKSLKIGTINGSENKIIVEPAVTGEEKEEFVEFRAQLEALQEEIEKTENDERKNMKIIEANTAGARALKVKIDSEANKALVAPLIAKLRAYNELIEKTKALKLNVKKLHEDEAVIGKQVQVRQDKILEAKITAEGSWKGFNTIKFKLYYPKQELVIKMGEKTDYSEVFLVKNDDKYEIAFSAR
jgi:hypothetical protein